MNVIVTFDLDEHEAYEKGYDLFADLGLTREGPHGETLPSTTVMGNLDRKSADEILAKINRKFEDAEICITSIFVGVLQDWSVM